MSAIDTNRNVILRADVQVGGAATFTGTVSMPGPVRWPASAGTVGQVMTLDGSNQLQWTSPAEFARVVVSGVNGVNNVINASSATPTMLIDRAGPTLVQLPAIASAGDKIYRVADISGSADITITIQTHGSETILGTRQFEINKPYNSVTLIHDGISKWALF